MPDDPYLGIRARWLWPVAAVIFGLGGFFGLVADLIEIDDWITSGGPPVIRVPAYIIIAVCIVVFHNQRFRRNRIVRMIISAVGLLSVALIPTAQYVWPAPTVASSAQLPRSAPQREQTTSSATASQAPVHTLEQWAADINKICAQEATRVGAAFEQIRSAGNTIIELSKQYRINTPLDVTKHADVLTPPMRQAFSAAATVDSSYTTTLRQMKSADWPTEPSEKTAAKTWVSRYEQLGDTFHTMYETLANYTVNENEYLQATFFTKFARLDGPTYLDTTTKVLDEGKELGVESCL
jgi:hypothetical protein